VINVREKKVRAGPIFSAPEINDLQASTRKRLQSDAMFGSRQIRGARYSDRVVVPALAQARRGAAGCGEVRLLMNSFS
jgi:hypothetical protein